MNALIEEMQKLASETSRALNEQYVTVELRVTARRGSVEHTFRGYTQTGGHTNDKHSLDEVSATIMPSKEKVDARISELRSEAERLEKLLKK